MADNFVKGETFDGETGYKTGAQLEDLVTEAQYSNNTGNNRLVDDATLDWSAGLNPDATGHMLGLKAGGVQPSHMAGGAYLYPRLTLLGGTGDWGSTLGFTSWGSFYSTSDPSGDDWANVIDRDVSTFAPSEIVCQNGRGGGNTGLADYMVGNGGVYVDLGAVYVGKFVIGGDLKSGSATDGNNAWVAMEYGDQSTDLTDTDFWPTGQHIGYGSETTYRPVLGIMDFVGRYVGFSIGSIDNSFWSHFKPSRFEVYGVTP